MAVPRVYYPDTLTPGETVCLPDATSHYLLHVLRLRPDDALVLFNGQAHGEYPARFLEAKKKQAYVNIESYHARNLESPLALHLGQAISAGDKMDLAIQKSVELGVHTITPLLTQYSKQYKTNHLQKKREHWQKIIISACEQCGRNQLPTLNAAQPLATWLRSDLTPLKLLFHPSTNTREDLPKNVSDVTVLIGPEGGLSEQEILEATQQDFLTLDLGPRILRTETAAMAAITMLQSRWGDL